MVGVLAVFSWLDMLELVAWVFGRPYTYVLGFFRSGCEWYKLEDSRAVG